MVRFNQIKENQKYEKTTMIRQSFTLVALMATITTTDALDLKHHGPPSEAEELA